jgi:hypothetical protein
MKRSVWMLAAALVAAAGTLEAKATWTKKAQAEDADVKTCLACHTTVKATAQDPKLNARGQFLVDRQKELKAAEIDFKWLKDYKEKK